MGRNREKSNIDIAILENYHFLSITKIISHFDGSNNIFADFIAHTKSRKFYCVYNRAINNNSKFPCKLSYPWRRSNKMQTYLKAFKSNLRCPTLESGYTDYIVG